MKEYLLISYTAIASILLQNADLGIVPIQTIYNYGNGAPVIVVDGRFIDSLGLRDWNDIRVLYPINLNDSAHIHKVLLEDNEIIH